MSDEERFRKWGRWIDRIHAEVSHVETTRVVLREAADIYSATAHRFSDHTFMNYVTRAFSTMAAMFVRRQDVTCRASGDQEGLNDYRLKGGELRPGNWDLSHSGCIGRAHLHR